MRILLVKIFYDVDNYWIATKTNKFKTHSSGDFLAVAEKFKIGSVPANSVRHNC